MYQLENKYKKLKHLLIVKQAPSNGYCKLTNPPGMKDCYTYTKTNSDGNHHKNSWPSSRESPSQTSTAISLGQLFHIHYNIPLQKWYSFIFVITSRTFQHSPLCICSRHDTLQNKYPCRKCILVATAVSLDLRNYQRSQNQTAGLSYRLYGIAGSLDVSIRRTKPFNMNYNIFKYI